MGVPLLTPDADETPSTRSFFSRWIGVYFSPGSTFHDIAHRPDFIAPLVVSIVSALVITETMLAKIGMERMIRNSIEQSGRAGSITAEQMQQAVERGTTIGLVMSHVGALLGPPIFLVIVAALALGIVNAIYGGQMNFKQSFAVSCYANLISVLAVLMALPVMFFGDPERFNPQNPTPTNIGFFLNPLETSKPVLAFTSSLDIFSFWLIALLGMGYSAATGGKVKAFSIGAIFFALWLVYVLAKVALSFLG